MSINHFGPHPCLAGRRRTEKTNSLLKCCARRIRSWNPSCADWVLDLRYGYEKGESQAAMLVWKVDKLECIQQANIDTNNEPGDLGEFMELSTNKRANMWTLCYTYTLGRY